MYKIKLLNAAISTNTTASDLDEALELVKKWQKTYGKPQVLIISEEIKGKE